MLLRWRSLSASSLASSSSAVVVLETVGSEMRTDSRFDDDDAASRISSWASFVVLVTAGCCSNRLLLRTRDILGVPAAAPLDVAAAAETKPLKFSILVKARRIYSRMVMMLLRPKTLSLYLVGKKNPSVRTYCLILTLLTS